MIAREKQENFEILRFFNRARLSRPAGATYAENFVAHFAVLRVLLVLIGAKPAYFP